MPCGAISQSHKKRLQEASLLKPFCEAQEAFVSDNSAVKVEQRAVTGGEGERMFRSGCFSVASSVQASPSPGRLETIFPQSEERD